MTKRGQVNSLNIISWIQIIGGIVGLISIFTSLSQTGQINGPLFLIYQTAIALFCFSIYAGRALLYKDKRGIRLSIINQVFQLFQLCLFGYGWAYSSGLQLTFGFKGTSFDVNVSFSSFYMYFNSNHEFIFSINVIAVFVLIVLWKNVKSLIINSPKS